MAKILVLCSRVPYPPIGGAKLRMYNTAKLLAREHDVEILTIDEDGSAGHVISNLSDEFSGVVTFPYSKHKSYINVICGLASQTPLQVAYYSFKKIHDWIASRYDEYDLIFCNHIRTAQYARGLSVPHVVDLVDAVSRTYSGDGPGISKFRRIVYNIEHNRAQQYERKIIDEFDASFITSSVDKEFIESKWRTASELTVVPNGVRPELLSYEPTPDGNKTASETIVFLGKMDYLPNIDAARYFSKEIFPLVRAKLPKAKFQIVGMDPVKEIQKLQQRKGIEVTGFVDDPISYLINADVVVAPLRHGSGIQNKVLEAMALGKSVVTTPLGAEGINGSDESEFVIANGTADFANDVVRLLNNTSRRRQIGFSARELIENVYTWEAVADSLLMPIQNILD